MGETSFLGYTSLTASAKVVALVVEGKPATAAEAGQRVELVLDSSPFYAESGGQVGDRGVLTVMGDAGDLSIRVSDVQKAGGGRVFLHFGEVVGSGQLTVGANVTATVDPTLRRRVRSRLRPVPANSLAKTRVALLASECSLDRRAATTPPRTCCKPR